MNGPIPVTTLTVTTNPSPHRIEHTARVGGPVVLRPVLVGPQAPAPLKDALVGVLVETVRDRIGRAP